MSVINTKGVAIYISKGSATATALVPTAISTASPAVVTVASATGLTKGDVVTFETTGFNELDGKTFVVGAVDTTANTFEVIGGNTTGTTGTLGATPKASVYKAADQVKLCLSGIEIGQPSTSEIDVSTFCGTASLPGKATPGSLSLTGYADKADAGLAELILADEDGKARFFEIVLPNDNGYFVGQVTFSGYGMTVPLEGAVGFTITGSQTQKIIWRH
jgi:hypothetical protein